MTRYFKTQTSFTRFRWFSTTPLLLVTWVEECEPTQPSPPPRHHWLAVKSLVTVVTHSLADSDFHGHRPAVLKPPTPFVGSDGLRFGYSLSAHLPVHLCCTVCKCVFSVLLLYKGELTVIESYCKPRAILEQVILSCVFWSLLLYQSPYFLNKLPVSNEYCN